MIVVVAFVSWIVAVAAVPSDLVDLQALKTDVDDLSLLLEKTDIQGITSQCDWQEKDLHNLEACKACHGTSTGSKCCWEVARKEAEKHRGHTCNGLADGMPFRYRQGWSMYDEITAGGVYHGRCVEKWTVQCVNGKFARDVTLIRDVTQYTGCSDCTATKVSTTDYDETFANTGKYG